MVTSEEMAAAWLLMRWVSTETCMVSKCVAVTNILFLIVSGSFSDHLNLFLFGKTLFNLRGIFIQGLVAPLPKASSTQPFPSELCNFLYEASSVKLLTILATIVA